jgi:hypothetical protein
VLALALAAPAALYGTIEHEATTDRSDDYLEVTIAVRGAEPERLFANLADGLTSRIEYHIRILQTRDTLLNLLGSRLIHEFRVIYNVVWDPFRGRYRLTTQDGGEFTFRDEATLWSFLFTLPDYRIPWTAFETDAGERRGRFVVETRAVYEPIVFASGLGILAVLLADSRQESAWRRAQLEVTLP